jgi:DNA-binding beta-propeller fold protein YncE
VLQKVLQRERFVLSLVAVVSGLSAQPSYPPPNDGLPNPYRTVFHWAQLPAGRHWGSMAGVTVAPDGKIWSTERCGNQHSCDGSTLNPILEWDQSGKYIKSIGSGLFDDPHGIIVDRDGNIWVTDERVSGDKKRGVQVIKLSPDGKVLLTLGKPGVMGMGTDTFGAPDGIIQAPNGDIYVADGHDGCDCPNARVMKFTKDGKFIKAWGTHGSGPGEFDGVHGLALDSQGRVFVADRLNNRVQVFTPNGKFIAAWKQFGRPSAIAIDKDDLLYVSDDQSTDKKGPEYNPNCKNGIRIGSVKDGKVTAFIPDPEPGGPTSKPPEGIAVGPDGSLYGASNGRPEDNTRDLKKYVKK